MVSKEVISQGTFIKFFSKSKIQYSINFRTGQNFVIMGKIRHHRNAINMPEQLTQKINAWFVKYFEKYTKIMLFCNFIKKIFEKFRKFTQNLPSICVFRAYAEK